MNSLYKLKQSRALMVVLYLLVNCSILKGQHLEEMNTSLTQEQFIKGCAAYRSNVIHHIIDVMVEFNQLVDSLKSIDDQPDGHEIFRERFMDGIFEEPCYSIKWLIIDEFPYFKISNPKAFKIYRKWGEKNRFSLHEINMLSLNQVIERDKPYKLTNLKVFWEEFSFYDIKANHTIVDVGAGNGFLSIIMAMTGLPLNIVMTEVNEDLFDYLEDKLRDPAINTDETQVSFVPGKEMELDIGISKADRIILRDTFHHLKYKNEMIHSIKDHLANDGYLIVMEATTDLEHGKKKLCKEATTRANIVEIITHAGFELIEEKIVDISYMMKFRKAN